MEALELVQVEIRVRSVAVAAPFYEACFGWQIASRTGATYVLCDAGTPPLFGLMEARADQPTGVAAYVLVTDARAAADLALELGGRVIQPRTPSGEAGWWSHTVDPWENELCFWEPRRPSATPHSGRARHPLVWIELRAPQLSLAVQYYRRLCGWSFIDRPGMEDFAFFTAGGRGGIGLVGGARGERLTSATYYLATTSIDATLARVTSRGGRVIVPSAAAPEGQRFAIIGDPDDNVIGLFEVGPSEGR